jgi:non-ribosomal peptide synthetase component E (peptide arylation enzyme)
LAIALYAAEPGVIEFNAVTRWLLDAGLAKWKLPEQIVVWDRPLPRTQSGKIQRHLVADGHERRTSLLGPRLAKRT